jgi:hypothetical protein
VPGPKRPQFVSRSRQQRVLYHDFLDPQFGLIHVRLQTWLPFTVQVYVNGHEWLAQQMMRKKLGFIHSNWVNDLRGDDRKPATPVVATEFVGTSVTSGGNGTPDIDGLDALLAANPGVKFHNRQRGYVSCTVTPRSWTSDYRIVEDVRKPGGPVRTLKSFVVEAGKPGALPA